MGTHDMHQEGRPVSEASLQHALLRGLIAPFADGELPREEMAAVEEHLPHCARCRSELALQQGISRALAREPTPEASAGLRRRVEWMGEPAASRREPAFRGSRVWAAAAAALVLIAISAGTALRHYRSVASNPTAQIPVLRDALADCRRAMARNFPRKADLRGLAEGLPFPIPVLDRPGVELFSTWKTTLAGSPGAGLAYRWRGIVVVQYTVPSELIRHQPLVGEALSSAGVYAASESGQGVVAVLADGSGTLLIAEVPPDELNRLIL